MENNVYATLKNAELKEGEATQHGSLLEIADRSYGFALCRGGGLYFPIRQEQTEAFREHIARSKPTIITLTEGVGRQLADGLEAAALNSDGMPSAEITRYISKIKAFQSSLN